MKRILCLVSIAAWLSFGHAKLTAGGEGRVRILANECVPFFFFFSLPAVLAFFTIKRTHSHKQGRCEDPRKGRKETESSSLHSIGLRSMGSNNNRSHKWTRKKLLTQIGVKKRRGKDAPMFFSLIYFFAPHSIFYILHNYVIPQAMSRAIRQTHSAFYPHRYRCLVSDW